jgi:type I restriction enzyme M protein
MPGQLFYSTQIPVSLWFLARNKENGRGLEGKPLRDRHGETLFIDARKLGYMEDRTRRNLSGEDVEKITGAYHAWRGDGVEYADVPGFCKSATLNEIAAHGFVLTPGRYVGTEASADDDEPFVEKMARLTATLDAQFAESARLEASIRENLRVLGFGG